MAVVAAIVAAVSATVSSIAAGAAAVGAVVAGGAITAGTMAAVGSALVAVSSVIGVAGLATSVIGLATGNKDLLKAGKIMGYIGLAAGVAGGLSGGIGGMMEGGAGFMEGVKGAFTGATGGAESAPAPADVNATGSTMFSSEAGTSVTAPIEQAVNVADDAAGVVAYVPDVVDDVAMTSIPGVSQNSQIYTMYPSTMQAGAGNALSSPVDMTSSVAAAGQSIAGSTPVAPIAPPIAPDAGTSYQSLVDSAITPPSNYVVAPPAAPSVANYVAAPQGAVGGTPYTIDTTSNPIPGYTPQPNTTSAGQNYTMDGLKQMTDPFKAASPATPAAPGMLASMPEWAKYAAMTSGAQGLTGLASGYFQGLSAEEKLKFEKLVNDQHQQQVNLMNTRSSYAPRVSFNRAPGGLVNA